MTPDAPWKPFAGSDSGAPEELAGAGVVALLPSGDAAWSTWASVELARAVARSGRRVFLCDLDFATPSVHREVAAPVGEGVTDFVLYGSSPAHVAREVEDRLLFVSTGTPVANSEVVYRSDRWDGFLEALSHAGACLMMLLPADAEGAHRMLERAGAVVALGRPDGDVGLGAAGDRLVLGLEPAPEADAPEVGAAFAPSAAQGTEATEPSGHESTEPEWVLDPAAVGPDPDDEPVITPERAAAMNRASRLSPRKKSRSGMWFLLLFILIVAIVAAGWYGLIDVPGITSRRAALSGGAPAGPREAAAAQANPASDDGPGAAGPEATDVPPTPGPGGALVADRSPLHAWGLRLGAFRNRSVARQQADLMASRAPGQLFVVAPVEVNGTRWFRLLSALAADEAEAEVMRGDLAARMGAADADDWLVRRSPLAFLVGETRSGDEARARVEELGLSGVDAFVLRLPQPDGGVGYRVYAGAYADEAEAATMRSLLGAAGVDDAPLVERRGLLPE